MTIQSVLQLKSSSNEAGEREGVSNKAFSGEAESLKRHSRDTLLYLTTCQIGHPVEVHLKNGSVYSGIFHAADVEKDFGIVLKMASLIAEGTLRGPKSCYEFVRKPPFKTFIIPADELVQVVAKDLSVSSDSMINAVENEKKMEMLMDSSISKSSHVNPERKLVPWVGDKDVPEQEQEALENVKGPRNSGFDKEDEKSLDTSNNVTFGGSSTSDVQKPAPDNGNDNKKLQGDRQPSKSDTNVDQSCSEYDVHRHYIPPKFDKERYKEFSAIWKSQRDSPEVPQSNRSAEDLVSGQGARKFLFGTIHMDEDVKFSGGATSEGKVVDVHRHYLPPKFDKKRYKEFSAIRKSQRDSPEVPQSNRVTKYSADCPVDGIDDSGFDKEDEKLLDTFNNETFGGSSTFDGQKPAPDNGNSNQELQGDRQPSGSDTNVDQSCSESDVHRHYIPPKFDKERYKEFSAISKSQRDSPEVPQSNRSAEDLVSGQGARKFLFGTIHMDEDVKFSGGATSKGKVVDVHRHYLPPKFDKKRYKEFSAIRKSQRDSPEVPQSNRSAEDLVSGQGGRKFVFGTIHMDEDVKFSGGSTSVGKVVGEREREVSQVSESSLEQVASRSSESCPDPPATSSCLGLSPNSPIGSLASSVETTPSPNAKVPDPKLNPREKSVKPLQPPGGMRPTSPISDASFYYPASSVQQMPVGHGDPMAYYQGQDPMGHYQGQDPMAYNQGQDPMGYYQGQDPMAYYQGHDPMGYYNHRPQLMDYYNHRPQPMEYYHPRQQNPQTYYPRNAQPQYPPRRQRQQMMPGHRRPPVVNTPPPS